MYTAELGLAVCSVAWRRRQSQPAAPRPHRLGPELVRVTAGSDHGGTHGVRFTWKFRVLRLSNRGDGASVENQHGFDVVRCQTPSAKSTRWTEPRRYCVSEFQVNRISDKRHVCVPYELFRRVPHSMQRWCNCSDPTLAVICNCCQGKYGFEGSAADGPMKLSLLTATRQVPARGARRTPRVANQRRTALQTIQRSVGIAWIIWIQITTYK